MIKKNLKMNNDKNNNKFFLILQINIKRIY